MNNYIDSKLRDLSIVAYHKDCFDGICAAAIVYEKFPEAVYVPVQYRQEDELRQVLSNVAGPILFVDFCPEQEFLEDLTASGRVWYVIDHHESRNWVRKYPNAMFDIEHSGAMLTWNFFHPNFEPPELVKYVQDRDLWSWVLDHSKAVNAYIRDWPLKVGFWAERLRSLNVAVAAADGQKTLEVQGKIAKSMAEKAKLIRLAGETIRMTNCTTLISETCAQILDMNSDVDIVASFFMIPPDAIFISLRSRKEVSCLPLAAKLGGGGHPNSAGAKLSLDEFAKLVEKV